MSEVFKRDKQIKVLVKFIGQCEADAANATVPKVTVWKERLADIWETLKDYQDAVLARAGASELEAQSDLLDSAMDRYDEASLMLEELRIKVQAVQNVSPKAQEVEVERTLRLRHCALIKRLQNMSSQIRENIEGMPVNQVDIHQRSVEQLHTTLQEIALERITSGSDADVVLDIEVKSDLIYYEILEVLMSSRPPVPNVMVPAIGANDANALTIPRLQISPFDGCFEKWEAFRESFTQGIHLRTNMPAVQKLQYLKSVLRNEPEELIQNFGLTNDNYATAWKLLNDRYNNVRELVMCHLDVLTSFPKCMPSADDLRRMANKTASCLLALSNLGRPVDQWSDWVVYHVSKKLDSETRRMWEQHQAMKEDLPVWDDLDKFLQTRIRALASCGAQQPTTTIHRVQQKLKIRAHQTRTTTDQQSLSSSWSHSPAHTSEALNTYECPCCHESHLITFCPRFRRMNSQDRRTMVAEKSLCFVCLKSGHFASNCSSTRLCQTCNQRHNSMLHQSVSGSEQRAPEQVSVNMVATKSQVLLATAIVNVRDIGGHLHKFRALLDQGSEASFVSESAAQTLRLKRSSEKVDIVGLSGLTAGRSNQSVVVNLGDRHGHGFSVNVRALIIPRVTSSIKRISVCANVEWPHLADIVLADPGYMDSSKIDLLLGSDVYGTLLLPGVRKYSGLPTAQNTNLGWILSGGVPCQLTDHSVNSIKTHHAVVDEQLAMFWELEEPVSVRRQTTEEQQCEAFFETTMRRDECGRIHVRLPMKSGEIKFGESQRFAVQRQLQIERRFQGHQSFADQYRQFMAQYIQLGHMREVPGAVVDMTQRRSMQPSSGREYFIPHHAVMKESSSTTKLRVVFDASRRTTSGSSLNEMMQVGPRLQDDLTAIMMRWRLFRIGFCADIKKMYRQIVVDPPDTDLQRIVWRPTTQEPMKVYQLCTVTYGTASAPYLAIKSVRALAQLESERYPVGADIVLNHFYVDDVLCGGDQLNALMSSGGFELSKWASNNEEVLSNILPEHREVQLPLDIKDGSSISALGVQWNTANDTIGFKIDIPDDEDTITKRKFLSSASRLYDPLGWLAPCIIAVKILFQSLWKLSLDWDVALPYEIAHKWAEIRSGLKVLKDVRISRWIGTTSRCAIEVHGFSDASMQAYAAVVYVRVLVQNEPPKIFNICAKTKVAPIKVISLPRLELCGAVLLVKVIDNVLQAMKWPTVSVHCWTDSTIVLAWLRGCPSKYNVFVANRTSEIQGKFPIAHWNHVISDDNPADCASRGVTPQQLLHHPLWWSGPKWLAESTTAWPQQSLVADTTEEVRAHIVATSPTDPWDLIRRYSSWRDLVRVTSWCLRFTHNCLSERWNRTQGVLTSAELMTAREHWVRDAQSKAYQDELRCLLNNRPIGKSSSLRALHPVLSADQIIVVGGRLANAHDLPSSARMPAIIPRRSDLSALLVSDAHNQTLHGGPSLMLAYLRRAYWVVDGPNEVRRFVKRCTVCFRYASKPHHQLMAALPAARVVASRPFRHCAMDYSGAIMVRATKGRGHHATKAYVAVFVCLATKATHIELVGDLTTTGFIAAYERFAARRGCCTDLYSDNATNYVGAAAIFQRTERQHFDNRVRNALATKGTTWHFSPPLSPHFNGLAESAIRSVKHHIRRVVAESTLTFEELSTVLTKVEACLNSRPLCPLSSDPDDFDALTPGHFLIGEPIQTIPQRDVIDARPSALTRWQLTQQMVQRIWKRWSIEYLHTLQQRKKWQTAEDNIRVGDLVLLLEDNLPPSKWALGRICDVHPGEDGHVRVVSIRTKNSIFKRSVVKVARLPIDLNT